MFPTHLSTFLEANKQKKSLVFVCTLNMTSTPLEAGHLQQLITNI